jgi:glycerol-3-phosphate dehydrogenase subunit B
VFEVLAGPPSVPGIRLGRRLETALEEAGVTVRPDARVRGFDATGGYIDRLRLQDGTEIAGTQYVLATGGVAGGGITSDRTGVTEAVFGCHVDAPERRREWAKREPLGKHPFARFGVAVDEGLRPLDDDGTCEYENLRAAGRVIGGFDPAAENSGGGVAVATGYTAGRLATDGG